MQVDRIDKMRKTKYHNLKFHTFKKHHEKGFEI